MGHSGFKGRTAVNKRNKDKHTKMGLCRLCSRKAKKGRLHCEYHLEYWRKKDKERKSK